MVLIYKCPGCGSEMRFDEASQKLHCDNCGTEKTVEEYAAQARPEMGGAAAYHCTNCGAELVTDGTTAATFCSYCGAPTILPDRLSGVVAPDLVIPFRINREQAQEAFVAFCKKHPMMPRAFLRDARAGKISGIYVPFWLYDCRMNAKLRAQGVNVRVYVNGETEYTEKSHYDVYRDIDLAYQGVPVDASERMDDAMMDQLEPYDYSELRPFNMGYLSGFLSEKYTWDDAQLFDRVSGRLHGYADTYVRSTVTGYNSTTVTSNQINITGQRAQYALLPVYTLACTYGGKTKLFAMNGQTGKIVGQPPVSASRVCGAFAGVAAAAYALLNVIGGIMG